VRVYIKIYLISPINIFYNYAGHIGRMYKIDQKRPKHVVDDNRKHNVRKVVFAQTMITDINITGSLCFAHRNGKVVAK
jgi:hypothetical protein